MDKLFVECDRAYRDGANIIILSDRGVDENHVAIPSLLAVSAIEQYLIRTKKRTAVSIILESGRAARRAPLCHAARLRRAGDQPLSCAGMHRRAHLTGGRLDKDCHTAIERLRQRAFCTASSRLRPRWAFRRCSPISRRRFSRRSAFRKDVVDKYFTNTVSPVGGIGLEEIAEGVEWRHNHAFDPLGFGVDTTLDSTGAHKLRSATESRRITCTTRRPSWPCSEATHRPARMRAIRNTPRCVDDETEAAHAARPARASTSAEDGGVPLGGGRTRE